MSVAELERPVAVRISDLTGQNTLLLDAVDPRTPVADLVGVSRSRMELQPRLSWQMRDNSSSRLLRHDQVVGDIAQQGAVDLTLQPDARLG